MLCFFSLKSLQNRIQFYSLGIWEDVINWVLYYFLDKYLLHPSKKAYVIMVSEVWKVGLKCCLMPFEGLVINTIKLPTKQNWRGVGCQNIPCYIWYCIHIWYIGIGTVTSILSGDLRQMIVKIEGFSNYIGAIILTGILLSLPCFS